MTAGKPVAPPEKGERVSKPPAAAGGILRDTTGGTGNGGAAGGRTAGPPRVPSQGVAGSQHHRAGDGGTAREDGGTARGDSGTAREDGGSARGDGVTSAPRGGWRGRVADMLEFARQQLDGDGEADQFGFDPEFNGRVLMPMARALYQRWFGIQMRGLSHVPEGRPGAGGRQPFRHAPGQRDHAPGWAAR